MDALPVVRVLGEEYSIEILLAAEEPKQAQTLSNQLEIPIATTYRRISELVETGLLKEDDEVLTNDRRRATTYVRTIDQLDIEFNATDTNTNEEDYGFDVSGTSTNSIQPELDEAWRNATHD